MLTKYSSNAIRSHKYTQQTWITLIFDVHIGIREIFQFSTKIRQHRLSRETKNGKLSSKCINSIDYIGLIKRTVLNIKNISDP